MGRVLYLERKPQLTQCLVIYWWPGLTNLSEIDIEADRGMRLDFKLKKYSNDTGIEQKGRSSNNAETREKAEKSVDVKIQPKQRASNEVDGQRQGWLSSWIPSRSL